MKNYDPAKGLAMSQYLPYGEFKWVKNFNNFDVNSISKNSLFDYILKVHVLSDYCKILLKTTV